MKKLVPDLPLFRSGLGRILLLALLLTLVQVSVVSHDAIHFSHADSSLCDQLQHGGHFPGLASSPVVTSLPPAAIVLLCAAASPQHSQLTYPSFHSRAPPR